MAAKTTTFVSNTSFQKIADGPTNLVLMPITGASSLVIKSGGAPSASFANTFLLKSGVLDGGFGPIWLSSGDSAYIKTLSGNAQGGNTISIITFDNPA